MATKKADIQPEATDAPEMHDEQVTPDPGRNLYQRILGVMSEVAYVQKEGRHQQGYKFAKHDDVIAKLRPALIHNGVVALYTTESHVREMSDGGVDKNGNPKVNVFSEVCGILTLINADEPKEREEVRVYGYGIDPQDKSIGKAISYACKYGLLKAFCLETGDDPEGGDDNYAPPKHTHRSETPQRGANENTKPPANGNGGNGKPGSGPQAQDASREIMNSHRKTIAERFKKMEVPTHEYADALKHRHGVEDLLKLGHEKTASELSLVEIQFRIFSEMAEQVMGNVEDVQLFLRDMALDKYEGHPFRADGPAWKAWAKEFCPV